MRAAPHGMQSSQNQSALAQLPHEIGRRSVPNAVGISCRVVTGSTCSELSLGITITLLRGATRPSISLMKCLTRPIGRPPNEVRRSYANFTHRLGVGQN